MKIVRKIIWSQEAECIFQYFNNTHKYQVFELSNCYLNIGSFSAKCVLEDPYVGVLSRIEYEPYIDPDYTLPEDNFRVLPDLDIIHIPDEVVEKAEILVTIPQGVKIIRVAVAPNDYVRIHGHKEEEYVIIDDDGNEIPLECLVQEKKRCQ